jgi:tRNA A-37 threonylcarbamoyl transferase component Bud32
MSLDITILRRRLQAALGDEFTVRTLLGEGGFAAVFRVRDKRRRRDVAVKVLDLGLTPSPSLAERFVREARTVARFEHPHIVPIYKVGGHKNEVLYIVMRCVDGPSLRQLLEKRRRLSVRDAARIARQVADAVGYAHDHGVVHRDIKPDNILLDSRGQVLVSDFGIAKAAQEASTQLTTEGMVVGTPQYMSPEQATGERVDARADIYALGIVLYHMLAGAPPFHGESAQAILMKQATATPTPIQRVRRKVPAELAAVLDRMLAKDPAERYQTAHDVSHALVEVVPNAARERVRVRVRRGIWPVTIRSLAGLGIAGGVGVVAFAAFSEPPQLSLSAPVPDSITEALQRRRVLAAGDAAHYVFVPRGPEDSVIFLVARRHVVVATPRSVRSYGRDTVRPGYGMDWRHGVQFRVVLRLPGGRGDTVYRSLSLREIFEMAPRLERLLADGSTGSAGGRFNP